MIKKALANLLVRKIAVFSGVLAAALVIMGNSLANQYNEADAGFLRSLSENARAKSQPLTLQVYHPAQSGGAVWDMMVPLSAEQDTRSFSLETWNPPPETDDNEQDKDKDIPASTAVAQEPRGSSPQGFVYTSKIPLSRELQEHTYEQCKAHGLDYELVLALMWRESRFTLEAVGYNSNGTQDSGVMQINDVNKGWLSRDMGITDLMDPVQNIIAGTTILGRFQAKYGEHNALMAYQYGEQGMRRMINQGVTTNNQIQIVYTKQADFKELLGGVA